MAKVGEGLYSRFLPKSITEKIRRVWEFKPDDPHRLSQVPPAEAKLPGVDRIKGYRYPAPNSRPMANVPTSGGKIDKRHVECVETRILAAELLKSDSGDIKPPSQGNKNPAVLKYDPTGLRSTMSASTEEMEKSIQKYMPNHLIRPAWEGEEADIMKEMELKGLPPVPGRVLKIDVPKKVFIATW